MAIFRNMRRPHNMCDAGSEKQFVAPGRSGSEYQHKALRKLSGESHQHHRRMLIAELNFKDSICRAHVTLKSPPNKFSRKRSGMERAARVLRKSNKPRSILDNDGAIQAVWPAAVGKAISRHTSRVRLVRKNLVVDAEDSIWQRQLRALERQILDRVRLLLPDIEIESIEFRIGVPRREPQMARSAAGLVHSLAGAAAPAAASDDEADRILDPVLKKVYQLSRRKATA
jgi:hypothetical protein